MLAISGPLYLTLHAECHKKFDNIDRNHPTHLFLARAWLTRSVG